jgi:hypothetical protein
MLDYPCELLAQQRSGIVVDRLRDGHRITTAEVQEMCGYQTREAARMLMHTLAAVLPLAFVRGEWFYLRDE